MLIRLKTVIQDKALNLGGASGFQIIRWGKEELEMGEEDSAMKKDLEENLPEDLRVQTIFSKLLLDSNMS